MSATTTVKYIDFNFKAYQAFLDSLSENDRSVELRRTRDYHGLCPGDSFVTRADFEAITSEPSVLVNGLQLTCSDGSPLQPVNYVGPSVPAIGFYPVVRLEGKVMPLGITDMVVDYYGKREGIYRIGYGGQTLGAGTEKVWSQALDDEVKKDCVLKGVDLWAKFPFIIGLGLQFQCQVAAPPTPPVSSSSAPLPVPEPTTPSSSSSSATPPTTSPAAPTPTPSSPSFQLPSVLPSSTPLPFIPNLPTPTTTTIFVTAGPLTTSLITVITPGQPLPPLTITLPADAGPGGPARTILLTQIPGQTTYAATTILMLRDPAASDDDGSVVLLAAIVCALALVAGALVVAVVALRRQEVKRKEEGRAVAETRGVEMTRLEAARGPAGEQQQQTPPVYVAMPVVAPGGRNGKLRQGLDGE